MLFLSVGMTEYRLHALLILRNSDQLCLPFDRSSLAVQMFCQQCLRLVLWQHQHKRVGAIEQMLLEIDRSSALAIDKWAEAGRLEARCDSSFRHAHLFKQFERSRHDAQRLRFLCSMGRAINDATV